MDWSVDESAAGPSFQLKRIYDIEVEEEVSKHGTDALRN